MIENPGTRFLRYPKVPVNCCNSFLDWGICSSSIFLKVSGGITALPASHQVPQNCTSLLGPRHFQGGISISALFRACHTAAAASPTFSGDVPPVRISSIHWCSFTPWGSETVRAIVGECSYPWGSLLKVYCIPPQVKANFLYHFPARGPCRTYLLYLLHGGAAARKVAVKCGMLGIAADSGAAFALSCR